MPKTFSCREASNMMKAVCGSYITREEIDEYFESHYDEDYIFNQDEIKSIVPELMENRKRITNTMNDIGFNMFGQKINKKNVYKEDDNNEER